MARSKSIHAFASVGGHGLPYATEISRDPTKEGRFEIFRTQKQAEKMAWSKNHVRRVRIILGEYTSQGKTGEQK